MTKYFKRKTNLLFSLFLISLIIIDNANNETKDIKHSMSIVVNIKNFNLEKHLFFLRIIKEINSTRNFYFVKSIGNDLIEDLDKIVDNSIEK